MAVEAARSAAVTSSRWASRWRACFPSQERDEPETGATASAGPPQNEDSAMTEAAIANHGLDLTRATCMDPVADGLPREKGWSADQQAFVQQHGSGMLDSSLLRMSSVGFASPYDPMWAPPRRRWTVQLISDRLVDRYDQRPPTACGAPRAPSRSARSSTSTRLPGRADGRMRLAFERC